ncbi:MAG: hypothetical protein P1Q69_20770 [Candidatus Thorarchaeota archaeon]|nr:hypothetical protein [Candidatus Thorarchaeota archaeon]
MTVRLHSLVLFLFLLSFTPTQSPANPIEYIQPAEDSFVHSATHTVPSGNYSYFSASIGTGHGFYGHFQVTQGYRAELAILDSANFENMKNGENYQKALSVEDGLYGDILFSVPSTDTWYFVLLNDHSGDSRVELVIYCDGTAPRSSQMTSKRSGLVRLLPSCSRLQSCATATLRTIPSPSTCSVLMLPLYCLRRSGTRLGATSSGELSQS